MRKAFLLIAAVAMVSVAPLAGDEPKGSHIMKAKLKFSKQVLAGLVNNDFDDISEGAEYLGRLGRLESWSRAFTPEYKAQLQIFYSANQDLRRMAKDKNLDGATLAYMQLTLSCVNCHKVVREPTE